MAAKISGIDPELARSIPVIEDRLRGRFPRVPPEQIRLCLDEAAVRADTARVRNFLPILIERWAAADLRAAS